MNAMIIGSGRMGIRHMQGLLKIDQISQISMLDIFGDALKKAKEASNNSDKVSVCLLDEYQIKNNDICIIASTANNRRDLIDLAVNCGCKYILVEKPLGQSIEEVESLIEYVAHLNARVFVNLNMRLYDHFIKLKNDLQSLPQLSGVKNISINTGSLGIGCNGIHFLDILNFLFDSDRTVIDYAEIEDTIIPSGRGKDFCDFGGSAVLKYYKEDKYLGKAMISMSSISTAYGGWEIIAPNGRIVLDEIKGIRVSTYRKAESELPIYRYAADYMPFEEESFSAPFLGDLTEKWVRGLLNGENLLPELSEALAVHKLMFEWLEKSNKYSKLFPIT